jgi:hypothetical protein
MARNGSGTYSLYVPGNPVITGTTISSTWANNTLNDIATALTNSIAKDGQTTPTANLPMGTFKLTGLGVGSAATDSANLGQIQAEAFVYLSGVSGTDTIAASTSPVTTAYAAGQRYVLIAPNTNTGAVTINVNSIGAKAVTKRGAVALIAGDLIQNSAYVLIYDGTQFQVTNPSTLTLNNDSVTSAALADSTQGFALINGTVTATPTANALVIAIKALDGTDPSASNPVLCVFRNTPITSGSYVVRSITAATSLTISSGSTLGTTSGVESTIRLLVIDNAGTVELAAGNNATYDLAGSSYLGESDLISTTAEGGAGGADSATVLYSTTARANVAYRNICNITSTQATAGTWITTPSKLTLLRSFPQERQLINSGTLNQGDGVKTALTFTGIPSWVKEIDIMLYRMSTSSTAHLLLQIGDAGGIENTVYDSATTLTASGGNTTVVSTAGFIVYNSLAVFTQTTVITLRKYDGNTWVSTHVGSRTDASQAGIHGSGEKTLSDTLTQLQLTTVTGTPTFDATGGAQIFYR